ncbi:flavin reductase (DIM6/NTAB) family NADH-FMN oxidoreductase RutF [Rhodobacter aestuarii]|uniref:NADH-FMN oxidoreductase RutF, flavin reductase (DIM6/NTAB) family n=1 Tax=Rhodobacter aestuarii TaxID=453582 RepID=A0A1N7LJF5_9RHOB|nr:flavin reductase family protein [Rhodobacter aestuarii]PTV95218.1 flavin reductase (DIM6/NTAB) family NADH-FMN oxidoreductase RutF [Rhodobacter aestuarii]SIS73914.1 NADH-FMN oxidoreductase RutF, flavin reductase (DIM6/NTAB) family [Rhodobacter aestuarii]
MSESDDIDASLSAAEAASLGHVPSPDDPRLLRDALGRFATGVTVVTAREEGGGEPIGITVNSFASVSLDPALVLWSAARSSLRHRHFTAAPAFAIHVLSADQAEIAKRFSSSSGPGFEGLAYKLNDQAVPLLDKCLARFECTTEAMHEGGDHTIIIGQVDRFTLCTEGAPLCFFGGKFGGFAPKT